MGSVKNNNYLYLNMYDVRGSYLGINYLINAESKQEAEFIADMYEVEQTCGGMAVSEFVTKRIGTSLPVASKGIIFKYHEIK